MAKEILKDMSDFELGALFWERVDEQCPFATHESKVILWKTYFDNFKLDQRTELIDFLRNNPPQRRSNGNT